MLHSDPAWASFALSSFNIFIEILLKGVLFKLFFTSLVFSSILQHCALLTSALLTCALFSSAHLSWTPLYQRPFVLRFFDGGLHQRALRAYVGEHLLWWPLNIFAKSSVSDVWKYSEYARATWNPSASVILSVQ